MTLHVSERPLSAVNGLLCPLTAVTAAGIVFETPHGWRERRDGGWAYALVIGAYDC